MYPRGSKAAPNEDFSVRAPLATTETLPKSREYIVTILDESPNRRECRTMASVERIMEEVTGLQKKVPRKARDNTRVTGFLGYVELGYSPAV